jgi:hypothetical protein
VASVRILLTRSPREFRPRRLPRRRLRICSIVGWLKWAAVSFSRLILCRIVAEIGRQGNNISIGHSEKIRHLERQNFLLNDKHVEKEQVRQRPVEQFAAGTAEAIGAAGNCLFSLLPYEERVCQATSWYDACTQATLRGNYSPLYEWIQHQACMSAGENFRLEDLLQLLRIYRRSAIEVERWDEGLFSTVDDVTNEGLIGMRTKVPWDISGDLNYLKESESNPPPATIREKERRKSSRGCLALPIRVRGTTQQGQTEEITSTQSVSLSGIYFTTRKHYRDRSALRVTYPFWTGIGAINREYSARVDRLDSLPDKSWGVAVKFLQNLRVKTT